jgi:GTPase SAR1 family protein
VDTAGHEEFDRLLPLSFPDVDVILLCSKLDRPDQFDSIEDKWMSLTLHFARKAVRLLVGVTDSEDFDDDEASEPANGSEELARRQSLAKRIGALGYLECDVRDPVSVMNIFNEVREGSTITRFDYC